MTLVPAKLGHALLVAHDCREEDRADLSITGVRKSLVDYLRRSSLSWALLDEGRCVAIGGAIGSLLSPRVGSLLSPRVHVWCAVTTRGMARPRQLLSAARSGIALISQRWPELHAVLLAGDRPAMRFAAKLGLEVSGSRMIDGLKVYDLVLVQEERKAA